MPNNTYTKEEMDTMISRMETASSLFYGMAQRIGCHAFIEFTGLMNKFIDICRNSAENGIQFPFANTHSGMKLAVEGHDVDYLAEKFDCIFGPVLENEKHWNDFLKGMGKA